MNEITTNTEIIIENIKANILEKYQEIEISKRKF